MKGIYPEGEEKQLQGLSRKFGWSGCEQIVTVVPTVFGVVVEVLVVVLVIMGVKESLLIVVVDLVV